MANSISSIIEKELENMDCKPIHLFVDIRIRPRYMGLVSSPTQQTQHITYDITLNYLLNYLIYDSASSGKTLLGLLGDNNYGSYSPDSNILKDCTVNIVSDNQTIQPILWYVMPASKDFQTKLNSVVNTIIILDEDSTDEATYLKANLFKLVITRGKRTWVPNQLYYDLIDKNNKFILINRDPFDTSLINGIKSLSNRKYSYCNLLTMEVSSKSVEGNRTKLVKIVNNSLDSKEVTLVSDQLGVPSESTFSSLDSKMSLFNNNVSDHRKFFQSSLIISEDSVSGVDWYQLAYKQGVVSMFGVVNLRLIYDILSRMCSVPKPVSILLDGTGTSVFGSYVDCFDSIENVNINLIPSLEALLLRSLNKGTYGDLGILMSGFIERLYLTDIYDKEGTLTRWLDLVCREYHNIPYKKGGTVNPGIDIELDRFRSYLQISDAPDYYTQNYVKACEEEIASILESEGLNINAKSSICKFIELSLLKILK